MRPRLIETHLIDAVKDESLPYAQAVPADFPAADILRYCPMIIVHPEAPQDSLPFDDPNPYEQVDDPDYEIKQLTVAHQRSFEVAHPALSEPWADEFGNRFGAINLKGNNFSNPGLIESQTTERRVTAYGLQESSVIRRVIKASRILRSHNVGTEYIVGLAEPQTYLWPTVDDQTDSADQVSLPEYKRRVVERHWRTLPQERQTSETLVDLSSKLEGVTFYVSMRAMDTSYRLSDLSLSEVKKEVFGHVNQFYLKDDEQPYNHRSFKDRERYLNDHFAPTAGRNLARLHMLGLAHRFPYFGNLTAIGSIVDLDSVHGSTLDFEDEPITGVDIVNDLTQTVQAIDMFEVPSFLSDASAMRTLVETYAQTVINESDATESMRLLGGIVAQLDKEIDANIYDSASDDERRSKLMINSTIKRKFLDHFFSEQAAYIKAQFGEWFGQESGIADDIKTLLSNEASEYTKMLFEDYINEVGGSQFEINKAVENIDLKKLALFRDFIMMDVRNTLINRYESHIITKLDQDEALKPISELNDPELIEVVCDSLAGDAIIEPLVAELTDQLEPEFMPVLKQAVLDNWQFEQPERLFPDSKGCVIALSADSLMYQETSNVPTSKLLSYLETSDEELKFDFENRFPPSCTSEFKVAEDGSFLAEIITDSYVEGETYNSVLPINKLSYTVSEAQYVMLVEKKPDGTRRLNLRLNDRDLVDYLAKLEDRSHVIKTLQQHFKKPSQLFNLKDYKIGYHELLEYRRKLAKETTGNIVVS